LVSSFAPELMTWPLLANTEGQATPDNLARQHLAAFTKGMTVLAIGPGLGQGADTARFVTGLLSATTLPAVIDADALNIVSQQIDLLTDLTKDGRTVVLTPHPGEMARLTGKTVKEIQANRVEVARSLATGKQVCLVLKGEHTLIAFPDGRVWINPTGTPAMATGGAGDILTGMVAGFLGQFPERADLAVAAAVYLHGLAGELGAAAKGEKSLIATDILDFLPQAIQACAHVSDEL
jgi:NAD(P)H-hydrate epimerase